MCPARQAPDIEFESSLARQVADTRAKAVKESMSKLFLGICDFEVIKTVGIGAFSSVRLVRHQGNGVFFAAKVMRKSDIIRLRQVRYLKDECEALLVLANRSSFVVQIEAILNEEASIVLLLEYISVRSRQPTSIISAGRRVTDTDLRR
eukprot:TRINITY_DN7925_c0_g1_i6.p2 TRINITY_DN7925_c0_g1~~TRINITY_DN7925_c0_g1_i6.p2  ORF type:complete len:149 (-),score=24.30 TRINITY_DN7925_c0_g1_i6:322-768(-)